MNTLSNLFAKFLCVAFVCIVFVEKTTSQEKWSGSCFAIGKNYLATNYHVVEGATNLVVTGYDGDYNANYSIEVVATDKFNDLAVLKITDSRFPGFGTLKYGFKTQTIDIGTDVFVLGYPMITTMGENIKLTTGVISAKSGYQGDVSQYQISAPVQPGNSGGPLFDSKGNVIGVVSAKHVGAENVGYAIKLSYLKNLLESSIKTIPLTSTNTISTLSLPEKTKAISPCVLIVKAEKAAPRKEIQQDRRFAESNRPSAPNSNNTVIGNSEITNPSYFLYSGDGSTKINKVTLTEDYTIVDLTYTNHESKNSWCSISDKTVISAKGLLYHLIKAENIAVLPEKTTVGNGKSIGFRLYFPKIPRYLQYVDIIDPDVNTKCSFLYVRLK